MILAYTFITNHLKDEHCISLMTSNNASVKWMDWSLCPNHLPLM